MPTQWAPVWGGGSVLTLQLSNTPPQEQIDLRVAGLGLSGPLRVWALMCSDCSGSPKGREGTTPATPGLPQGLCVDGPAEHGLKCWGRKEPALLREVQAGPVLTTPPRLQYPQSQGPRTHRQSRWAHGTWVARLPWRTLQRKVDMISP